jgi:outer membrane protein insertion porin family
MLPFLLLLLALPGAAQSPARKKPAAPPAAGKSGGFPLSTLTVRGNRIYTAKQVVEASGLKVGQNASKEQFEAAHSRLMKTGAFESVSYQFGPDASGKGIDGVFTVTEVEQIYPFRFEDLPVKDAEIRQFLKSREPLFEAKIPGTKEFLDRVGAEVKEFAASKGFKDGIAGKLVADGPGQLAVVFRPSTPVPAIGEVKFTGNEALANSALHNTFGLVAIGVPYTEQRVRDLLESSIRPLYESRGRMHVSFPKIEAKKMATVDGLSVTVTVDEGPVYKLRDVKVTGSTLPAKELLSAANLKTGEVVNFDEVRAAIDRIQAVFRKQGFMRSETTMERQVIDKDKVVDVQFKSVEGRRFLAGKLVIEGLDVTTEPAIRKLWSMTEGKPFNADYPQFFLDRVREDGYLENLGRTRFESNVNEKEGTVDVTLYFTGAPPEPAKKKRPEANF